MGIWTRTASVNPSDYYLPCAAVLLDCSVKAKVVPVTAEEMEVIKVRVDCLAVGPAQGLLLAIS